MSLLNRESVKGAVVTTATGVVLKKARGFLRDTLGLNKRKSNTGVEAPQVIGKRTTKNFQFPLYGANVKLRNQRLQIKDVIQIISLAFVAPFHLKRMDHIQ